MPADSCASSFCATAVPGWACSSSIAPGMRRRSSGYGSTESGETALDRVRTGGAARVGDSCRADARASPRPTRQTVVAGDHYHAGWLHRLLLGAHYRDLWATPLEVDVLDSS